MTFVGPMSISGMTQLPAELHGNEKGRTGVDEKSQMKVLEKVENSPDLTRYRCRKAHSQVATILE